MARKEGFELEEAISCGGKCHRFRFFRSFCWYIIAFRAPLYIRLKGENKGGKLGWLPPSTAGSSGDQMHVQRCCCALWAAWRPPSAAGGDEGQAHVRRRCCALWAA